MKNVALIFPGQGAQKVGMGLELYQNSPKAKEIFDQADGICPGLSKVIFEGPEEKLTSTAFCQPAIFTVSAAAYDVFKAHPKFKDYDVKFTAGHSLGEYAALYAVGTMDFKTALQLVQRRAACMEEATRQAQGAMAAVIGFDAAKLVEICKATGAQVANYNSNEQIVITGHKEKVEAAMEAIKVAGGQKIIPLTVSGAFHSSLMSSAAEKFRSALAQVHFSPSSISVMSNVSALPYPSDEAQIRENLARQITGSVQWVKDVEYMANQGITQFIEIGPGKVLKGLIRRINPNLSVANIEKPQDIETIV